MRGEAEATHERDDGVNVPPAPPSERVTVSLLRSASRVAGVAGTVS